MKMLMNVEIEKKIMLADEFSILKMKFFDEFENWQIYY